MILLHTHIVPKINKASRLSDYCTFFLKEYLPSKNAVKKSIKKGAILLNDKKASTADWVQEGDVVCIYDLEENPPKPYPLELQVVYEDEYLGIINKPAGISTSGNQFRTIQNAIVNTFEKSMLKDALNWARPVHRLDTATSGLLVIAKTHSALKMMDQLFKNRQVQKTYHAVVLGKIKAKGIIDRKIENKEAITYFKRIECKNSLQGAFLSLVALQPKTGRTHQLRIHLSQIGHPILGDSNYGEEGLILKHKGLFLCATELVFPHLLMNKEIKCQIDIPSKFMIRIERQYKMWQKYQGDRID